MLCKPKIAQGEAAGSSPAAECVARAKNCYQSPQSLACPVMADTKPRCPSALAAGGSSFPSSALCAGAGRLSTGGDMTAHIPRAGFSG